MRIDFYYLVPGNCGVAYNEGIGVLSAIAKAKGAETSLKILNLENLKTGVKIDKNVEIYALSFCSQQYHLAKKLVKEIKEKSDGIIVAGGVHATVKRDSVIQLPEIDMVVSGEGEPAIQYLLDNPDIPLEICSLPNVYIKGRPVLPLQKTSYVDINQLPFPDRSIFVKHLLQKAPEFILSRGCPYSCSYCVG